MNVCPICEDSLSLIYEASLWEIWSGSNNRVYNVSRISLVGNKKEKKVKIKTRHRIDFEADL